MTSYHPNRGRPAFHLPLDGSPKRIIVESLHITDHQLLFPHPLGKEECGSGKGNVYHCCQCLPMLPWLV